MDSPEGRLVAGTPLSKVEDSPVFNFLNNLSPIKPVKSVHSIHAYTSPGFSSISSVFSSPHINQQKETRFLIRHSYSESSKPDDHDHAEDGIGGNLCTGVPDCVGLSASAVLAHESCTVKCSLNEATLDPPEECLALTSRLPGSAQYGCSSPDHNITPCYGVKLDPKFDLSCPEDKRKNLFSDEFAPAKNLSELTKEEVSGSDWENIVYTDADDLLIFDDSTEAGVCEGQDEKLGEKDATSLTILSSELISNAADRTQKRQTDAYFGPCLDNIEYDPPSMRHKDVGEKDETDHVQHVFSGACQDQVEVSNLCREGGDGVDDGLSFNSMIDSQQRGIRRRCLVFDASGVSRRNSQNASNSHSSDFMQSSTEFTCSDLSLASVKPGAIPSPCVLPGIGLHLNTLASNSRDRTIQETLASERGLTGRPFPIDSFPPISTRNNSLNRSLAVERDQDSICDEDQNSQIVLHDSFLGTELGSCEELSQSSPKKKKRKPDSGEGDGCKRCNCKKSKCLKLYCECFAAGVYCIESCSCQECFNKPIHEETVLSTRKQIETRNPLAFAPKVIRTSETFQDMREETNTTPASARHKRGCNCKKSSCLKKYCECFQGGVGCSLSCRCEGCKNAFGRKDGVFPMGNEEIELPDEEINACGKEEEKLDDGQANGVVQKDAGHVPESVLLTTPRPISRSSAKQSNRKPPRSTKVPIEFSPMWDASQMLRKSEITFPRGEFEKHANSVPEDTAPEILRGNASPSNCVKTASPNSKRVSPPHIGVRLSPSCKGGRKMILKSIPSFPSLNSDVTDECQVNQSSTLP